VTSSQLRPQRPGFDQQALNAELEAAGADLNNKDEILRSVLSGCGDCIKILDMDGRLQFMSEGGKRVMEVEDFSALKGCPWPDFWKGQGNADAHAAIASAKAGKIANFRGAANTAKGSPRYWDVTVSPINGTDGRPYQILSISRDVTIQHELEERQQLLAGELVHRIKNTLAVAVGIARQTLRGIDPKAERDALTSRLVALSKAQDILIQSSSSRAAIEMVIRPWEGHDEIALRPLHFASSQHEPRLRVRRRISLVFCGAPKRKHNQPQEAKESRFQGASVRATRKPR
jgi:two-component sensor histidine kinase